MENPPRSAIVRVQLAYPKEKTGESAEVILSGDNFSIPVEFLTQSRGPIVNGLFEKCNRKPESVIVTLVQQDSGQELDRISLKLDRDFKMVDTSAYALRADLVLHSPQ